MLQYAVRQVGSSMTLKRRTELRVRSPYLRDRPAALPHSSLGLVSTRVVIQVRRVGVGVAVRRNGILAALIVVSRVQISTVELVPLEIGVDLVAREV